MDLLIGSDHYWCYLTGEVKLSDRETLVSVNYLFGWMLSGSIEFKSEELVRISSVNVTQETANLITFTGGILY